MVQLWDYLKYIILEALFGLILIFTADEWGNSVEIMLETYVVFKLMIYPFLVFVPFWASCVFDAEILAGMSTVGSLVISPILHVLILIISISSYKNCKNESYTWAVLTIVYSVILVLLTLFLQIPIYLIFSKYYVLNNKEENGNQESQEAAGLSW